MYLNYDQRNKLTLTKLTCVMTVQAIFFILAMIYLSKTVDTFNQFGWGVDRQYDSANALPLWAQSYRLNFLYFFVIYGLATCFNCYYSYKIDIDEWKYLPWFCLFSFILFPYFWILTFKSGEISYNWCMYFRGSHKNKSNIDLTFKKSDHAVKVNTIVFLIALTLTLVGFILIFINPEDMFVGDPKPSGLWLLNKLCYFTNLSNIFCFFYLLVMLFFNRAKIFNNNGFLIALTTYIVIVGVVYWCALFPVNVQVDAGTDVSTKWARAIWLHTIDPIIFLIFMITSMRTNKLDKTPLKKIWGYGFIYPLAYGVLMYSIPFLIQATIYGRAVNLNPQMILPPEIGDTKLPVANGNPLWILLLPLIVAIFIGVISLFYYIDYKISFKTNEETKHPSLY